MKIRIECQPYIREQLLHVPKKHKYLYWQSENLAVCEHAELMIEGDELFLHPRKNIFWHNVIVGEKLSLYGEENIEVKVIDIIDRFPDKLNTMYLVIKDGDAYNPIHGVKDCYKKIHLTLSDALIDIKSYRDMTALFEINTQTMSIENIPL